MRDSYIIGIKRPPFNHSTFATSYHIVKSIFETLFISFHMCIEERENFGIIVCILTRNNITKHYQVLQLWQLMQLI